MSLIWCTGVKVNKHWFFKRSSKILCPVKLIVLGALMMISSADSQAFEAKEVMEDNPLLRSPANPLLSRGVPGSYDQLKIGPRAILRQGPGNWKMWYEAVFGANKASAGYATSPDGIQWTKYTGNPIITPSEPWEGGPDGRVGEITPTTVLKENGIYKMWYHSIDLRKVRRIGYATSHDGLHWKKYPSNPILKPGGRGHWDAGGIGEPMVIKVNSDYYMYYMRTTGKHGVGLALSPDGINWTKYSGNPILTVGPKGSWDDTWMEVGGVVYDGKNFHMWYRAQNRRFDGGGIGYAWSPDGKNWLKSPKNPLLKKPPSPIGKGDDHGMEGGINVLRVGNEWWVYYAGMVYCCPENMGLNLAISQVKSSPKQPPR
jgi:predicted GH43/DUF377 family glycosyl hydrolase